MAPTHDDSTHPDRPQSDHDDGVAGVEFVMPEVGAPQQTRRGAGALPSADVPGRGSRVRVITLLAVVVVAVAAAAWWFSGTETSSSATDTTADPRTQPSSDVAPTGQSSQAPSTSVAGSDGLTPVPPIPSGGVTPIAPPADEVIDPAGIVVVDPPQGDPTASELSTPDSAVRAWLTRWCPFKYTDPFAAAEQRARAAMTDAGWAVFDPSRNDAARDSWTQTVAARESGRCAAPAAAISPEAPRTDTSAIVIASIDRVITAPGQDPYVEQLPEVRIVKRGTDGLWRVDLPTSGG